jgi:hypothetical protein
MRTLVVVVVVLLTLSTGAAEAGSRFDATSEAYVALPPGGAAYIEKLAAALDRGTVKALVAVWTDEVLIEGRFLTRARLKAAIKTAGGVDEAFGLTAGTWTVETSDGDFAIHRGDSTSSFVVGMDASEHFGLLKIEPPEKPSCSGDTPGHIRIPEPVVTGALEAKLVRRYLRRHGSKLNYCYDKRLLALPDLPGGEVSFTMTVGADGKVQAATATGIDDNVSSCVAGVIKAIELPKPTDGATASVKGTMVIGMVVPGVFDTTAPSCAGVPAGVRLLAEKLAAAVEADDTKAFLALLPASVELFGKKISRAKLGKAIAKAGALRTWLGLDHAGTPWTVREWFGEYEVFPYHGEMEDLSARRTFVLQKRGKKARLRAITDD